MDFLKQLKRFRDDRRALGYLWVAFGCSIVFLPLIVRPLNSALVMIEENLGYTFVGPEAFAIQVINVVTSWVLLFCLLSSVFELLVKSKAENANMGGY